MPAVRNWLLRQSPGVAVVLVATAMFFAVRLPQAPAADRVAVASRYSFVPMSIELPGGFREQTIRRVNRDYRHIQSWVSSVGAAVAMNDLDGDGLANDLCVTDPRIDQVVVTPVPGARSGRYRPFALSAAGVLPMNRVMAPMGCVPGDFNEDGRMDLLVYMWGRTPIVYLARGDARALTAGAYAPVELVPNQGGSVYTGPQWNSTAAAVDDFDGDGHDDIYIGNYFQDGPVLDDSRSGGVTMNRSLSDAHNGGEDHLFRWTAGTAGAAPTARFQEADALPEDVSKGWVLALGANDMDGDQLPELYVAQDHGPDALLYNRSRPGRIEFSEVEGVRGPMSPKSMRLGDDSFKGMGIDFADLDHDGLYDMFVSNITTTFGLQESNLHFVSTAKDQRDLRAKLRGGEAPWEDRSASAGTAWAGWGWDVKIADFDNSGDPAIVQTTGFIKGEVNRWAQLQELATTNDVLLEHEMWWPHFKVGDDISGNQTVAMFAKAPGGRYVNVAKPLGLAVPVPTRGVATGDADGDGRIDMAIARQWDEPVFYHNQSPAQGAFLGLRLTRDTGYPAGPAGALPAPGSPVTGAQVTVTMPDGRVQPARVDGGSGHSGKRSHEVHLGLGAGVTGPVKVSLRWRDRTGQVRRQQLQLTPGWHALRLGAQATER